MLRCVKKIILKTHDEPKQRRIHCDWTNQQIFRANQWTGFYMMQVSTGWYFEGYKNMWMIFTHSDIKFFFFFCFFLFCLINLYGWFVSFFEISFSIKKKKCFSQEEISLESYTSNITSANNFLATRIVSCIQFCVIFTRLMFFILIVFSCKHNLT